jgi:hypothetical protein
MSFGVEHPAGEAVARELSASDARTAWGGVFHGWARARSSSIPLRSIFRIGSSRASILATWGEFSRFGFPRADCRRARRVLRPLIH